MAQSDQRKISVIVTAYNIEKFLERCVDSLLAQTYKPLEIILVDDGSEDKTPLICDRYEEEYENIKVLHRENGGPSAARNSGLKLASGDYIGYVDGDDFVEPEMYAEMLNACIETKSQIAICTYRQIGEGGEEIHPTGNRVEMTGREAMELYVSGHSQYHVYPSVWSKLFERELLSGIHFVEGRKSEDIMYTTWALARADKCVFLDTAYYNYTIDRKTSIMNSRIHERRFDDEIPFLKEQIGYLYDLGWTELAQKAAYQFYRRMLFYFIDFRNRKMKKSAKLLMEQLKAEKEEIRRIYDMEFIMTGDKVRMKLALAAPGLYYILVRIYDKVIIPLR